MFFLRAISGYSCKGTPYETNSGPVALVDIGCSVNYLYTEYCPGRPSGCGHDHDVCLLCESKYEPFQ